MYCRNTKTKVVNELRYDMFCAKKGDVSSGQLPPCKDALLQHTKRANYQAAIWRRSLQNTLDPPEPSAGHGWHLSMGEIAISWLTGPPAPEIVLSLTACKCPRVCTKESCSCIQNGLPWPQHANCRNVPTSQRKMTFVQSKTETIVTLILMEIKFGTHLV